MKKIGSERAGNFPRVTQKVRLRFSVRTYWCQKGNFVCVWLLQKSIKNNYFDDFLLGVRIPQPLPQRRLSNVTWIFRFYSVRWDLSCYSVYRETKRNLSQGQMDSGDSSASPPRPRSSPTPFITLKVQPASSFLVPPFFSWGAACWLQQQTPPSSTFLKLMSHVDPCLLPRMKYNFLGMGYV